MVMTEEMNELEL